eukprot:gene5302-10602_t
MKKTNSQRNGGFRSAPSRDESRKNMISGESKDDMANRNNEGQSKLISQAIIYAENNKVAELKTLLHDNPDIVNGRGTGDYTALMRASKRGNFAAVKLLVDHGASMDLTNESGYTAMMFAISNGHLEIVNHLAISGADVNTCTLGVGYGDFISQSDSARIFTIFFILLSVTFTATAISNFGLIKLDRRIEKKRAKLLRKRLDFSWISQLDMYGRGVDKATFLAGILCVLHDIKKERDIDPWLKRFEELDVDGNGLLEPESSISFHSLLYPSIVFYILL